MLYLGLARNTVFLNRIQPVREKSQNRRKPAARSIPTHPHRPLNCEAPSTQVLPPQSGPPSAQRPPHSVLPSIHPANLPPVRAQARPAQALPPPGLHVAEILLERAVQPVRIVARRGLRRETSRSANGDEGKACKLLGSATYMEAPGIRVECLPVVLGDGGGRRAAAGSAEGGRAAWSRRPRPVRVPPIRQRGAVHSSHRRMPTYSCTRRGRPPARLLSRGRPSPGHLEPDRPAPHH